MKGSPDWMSGWKDHEEFIEPFRQRLERGKFILGLGIGFFIGCMAGTLLR